MDLIEELFRVYKTQTAPKISKETGVPLDTIKSIVSGKQKKFSAEHAKKFEEWLTGKKTSGTPETLGFALDMLEAHTDDLKQIAYKLLQHEKEIEKLKKQILKTK